MYGLWVVLQKRKMDAEIQNLTLLLLTYSEEEILHFINQSLVIARQVRDRQILRNFFEEGE